jgi:manganese/zinc-transporting P-type ATPase C
MTKPDTAFTICHAIPGRIRCRVPAMGRTGLTREKLAQTLGSRNGVRWVRINDKCNSVIIRYKTGQVTQTELAASLGQLVNACNTTGKKTGKEHTTPASGQQRNRLPQEIIRSGQRFAGLSLLAAMVLVRRLLLRTIPAQTLFSPLGLITAAAALPLIRKGCSDIKNKHISLESFLGGSIVTAAAAGEAVTALEILWITSAGELLQAWITHRSRRAIRDILEVTQKDTFILKNGVEISIPVEKVSPGDTVVLHTGEKIAVDGRVIRGSALVDESSITGRSEPETRSSGDRVYAGTFVSQGVIFVQAEQVGDQTYLARILNLVEDSLENRAPIESVADRLARNLIKSGFIVTLATLVITRSLQRTFTVLLVMACPCATILAASTAVSAALSAAARRHILIKGGRYLEEAASVNFICFDKTGTLTTSEPEIRQVVSLMGLTENELIQLAYSTEIHNAHPVALALKKEAARRGIPPIPHDECEYILGKGVRSVIHGDEVLVGSHKLMAQYGIEDRQVKTLLEKHKHLGLTQIFIARKGTLLGTMGFANQERPDLEHLLARLRKGGVEKTAMITGDARYTALEMAARLKFDECRYSVLPAEKADIIRSLRNTGDRILMVGDGINDALALAEADIGVAMGAGGSEVAIEAADIALVTDDLTGVIYVRELSAKTLSVVHQNFWIATGSNIGGVVLGAAGLLSPVMAGLVHIIHTLGILANSSRLLFFDIPETSASDNKRPKKADPPAGRNDLHKRKNQATDMGGHNGPT